MASVGPLLVPGRSKYASTSPARCFSVLPSRRSSVKGCGDAVADRLDQALHQRSASGSVRFAVGGDHALVDAPGRFNFDVVVAGEQRVQSLCLLVGEEVGAGVQGPPGGVEGVCGAAAVPRRAGHQGRRNRSHD